MDLNHAKQFMRSLYWGTEREINHIATGRALSPGGELLPPHHGSSNVDGDGGGVDGDAFRGAIPRPGGVPEQRLLSPETEFRDGGGVPGVFLEFRQLVTWVYPSVTHYWYTWIGSAQYGEGPTRQPEEVVD